MYGKDMISGPSDFKHVSHISDSSAKGRGFNFDKLLPSLKAVLMKAGVTREMAENPETASFIENFIRMQGYAHLLTDEAWAEPPPPTRQPQQISSPPPSGVTPAAPTSAASTPSSAAASTAAAPSALFVLQVPFEELNFTTRNIGIGTFKKVHSGTWGNRPVAIQQMPAASCARIEPELMALIGRHANLLHFFGQVSECGFQMKEEKEKKLPDLSLAISFFISSVFV